MRKYKNVRFEILRQDRSMIDLSTHLRVNPFKMNLWFNGDQQMPEGMREKISSYLKMPPEVLFEGTSSEYFKLAAVMEGVNGRT